MKSITLALSVSTVLIFGCSPGTKAVTAYEKFISDWKKADGKGIHSALSKKWRAPSDAAYWRTAAKDPNRTTVKLPKKAKPEWTAKIDIDNARFAMKKTGKGWKLQALPFPSYSRQTPEDAVASFIMALEFQRLEILSTLLTEEFRLSLSKEELARIFDIKRPEVAELLTLLKKARGTPVMVREMSAVFPYTSTRSLKLVKQDDGWCIVDPD